MVCLNKSVEVVCETILEGLVFIDINVIMRKGRERVLSSLNRGISQDKYR